MAYKFLPHTGDVKFQAEGKTLEEAFSEASLALKEAISGKIKIKEKIRKNISMQAGDTESLLYNFLEEFLYLLDAEDFIPSNIKSISINCQKSNNQLINKKTNNKANKVSPISAEGTLNLTAIAIGDQASNYKFTNDVKAITYNDMFIKKQKDKFIVQAVLDV